MIQNLLLDLDGTLTDSKLGIIRCVQHALTELGQPMPPDDDQLWFIGPPLRASFEQILEGTGEDVEEAVTLYRERFGMVGLLENDIYDGVTELLAAQAAAGKRQFIA